MKTCVIFFCCAHLGWCSVFNKQRRTSFEFAFWKLGVAVQCDSLWQICPGKTTQKDVIGIKLLRYPPRPLLREECSRTNVHDYLAEQQQTCDENESFSSLKQWTSIDTLDSLGELPATLVRLDQSALAYAAPFSFSQSLSPSDSSTWKRRRLCTNCGSIL